MLRDSSVALEEYKGSLIPRPSLTAFFATVEKNSCEKAVMEGLDTRLV